MQKIMLALCELFITLIANAQNDKADNILGTYAAGEGKDAYKIQITKLSDGTYQGQICWLATTKDDDGNVLVDKKNPDKSLRNTPMDKVVLFKGLEYDSDKKQWGDTKIYDPERGIQAKMTAKFENASTLIIRGSVLGIGESVTWKKQ